MKSIDDIAKNTTMWNIIKDLISDVRAAKRDGLPLYAEKCKRDIAKIWPFRNTGRKYLNKYGWPVDL